MEQENSEVQQLFAALAALEQKSFASPWSAEQMLTSLTNSGHLLLCLGNHVPNKNTPQHNREAVSDSTQEFSSQQVLASQPPEILKLESCPDNGIVLPANWNSDQVGRMGGMLLFSMVSDISTVAENLKESLSQIVETEPENEIEILRICVAPEFRRIGCGTSLLDGLSNWTLENKHGASRLFLEVRADNIAAIKLYERNGYKQYHRRRRYYRDNCDALLFQKEVPDQAGFAPAR